MSITEGGIRRSEEPAQKLDRLHDTKDDQIEGNHEDQRAPDLPGEDPSLASVPLVERRSRQISKGRFRNARFTEFVLHRQRIIRQTRATGNHRKGRREIQGILPFVPGQVETYRFLVFRRATPGKEQELARSYRAGRQLRFLPFQIAAARWRKCPVQSAIRHPHSTMAATTRHE